MTQCSDGFRIAEEDLKLRGPGDFFGDRQHGLPQFKVADLSNDIELLQEAQQAAKDLLAQDPGLRSTPPCASGWNSFSPGRKTMRAGETPWNRSNKPSLPMRQPCWS